MGSQKQTSGAWYSCTKVVVDAEGSTPNLEYAGTAFAFAQICTKLKAALQSREAGAFCTAVVAWGVG